MEQLLYKEARLLDSGRFDEWLALFTDDVRYWAPIRETVAGSGFASLEDVAVAHIDDDHAGLEMRVKRLGSGLAHAETPPSRTRRLITNIEAALLAGGEVEALSNFLLFEGRREHSEFLFSGRREDRLRRDSEGLRISARTVYLDHTVLPRAISVFF